MTSNPAYDPTKSKKIEECHLRDHWHLSAEDQCYFFDEYPTAERLQHPGYSRITNFKHSVDRQNLAHYKKGAIQYYARILRDSTASAEPPVPIIIAPTSKSVGDPLYDDRLLQTLEKARQSGGKIVILDLFETIASRPSLHANEGQRRSIDEIKASIRCRPDVLNSIIHANYRKVVFFDDMVTTGCTFIACRQKLYESLAERGRDEMPEMLGVFLSRRVPPHHDPLEDFDDLDDAL